VSLKVILGLEDHRAVCAVKGDRVKRVLQVDVCSHVGYIDGDVGAVKTVQDSDAIGHIQRPVALHWDAPEGPCNIRQD
jgi:hypothetical protein